ncbi:MAG: histidine kinase [Kastovskya adunca ATA6-11-RM4]|jgi:two-component system clock-associated histidine kinase SasA|nr:histidine kinase [Kastovskya adunca ATA6-11-RM4]
MQVVTEKPTSSESSLQLLLFIDDRLSSRSHIQRIRDYLGTLRAEYPFELMESYVGEQPYLAEHFKLVATPALIKIYPEPRQILTGSNLVAQLKNWWPRWHKSAEECDREKARNAPSLPQPDFSTTEAPRRNISSVSYSAESIRLADEIFRLKKEKEKLLEQLRFKDQVIGMLAHDLRNPLTAASIALDTLELEQQPQDSRRMSLSPALKAQLFKQARNQFRTIERMITDILKSAKGASADLNIQPQKLQISELCQSVFAQMNNQFHRKLQQLDTDIPHDLPEVYADREWVRQVIVNLLDNAIKYTPEGGKIHIAILHRTSQKIQVSVSDSGPGIPEELCDRIFEDHFRLKRDEKTEGYGLGLSLCQRVVRAHYGQIWVDSNSKTGSCFHFTLPVYRA